MSRIEFTAELKDNAIEIPKEHQGLLHGVVHVIIEAQEQSEQPDMIAQLLAQPLRIANFTPLGRDEAHDRR